MTGLLQHIEQSVLNRRLLKRGQKILVAVSGGLDSMVLLHLLHALAARYRWKLVLVHFNHKLRGRSSNADERLVRKTARTLKLRIIVGRAEVRWFAKKSKLSVEMAARKLRHEFFARVAGRRGLRTVTLAHHADDQVELFFLRLLRGTGGEGLAGMKWRSPSPVDSSLTLIRPLLDLTKAELREYARENKIRFREDRTNATLAMLRNRIRNELLPLLREKYQPGLAQTVLRLMDIAGAETAVTNAIAREWLEETGRGVPAFANLPVAVQRRILQLRLSTLGVPADFELIERLRAAPGKPVSVSSSFSAERDETGRVQLRSSLAPEFDASELKLELQGRAGRASFSGVQFRWGFQKGITVGQVRRRANPPRRVESFDADRVGKQITLRHWRPGDRFQPIGNRSPVKLQDWFVNQKIPRARRHQFVVATSESGEIFWIEGLRISEHFKLTPRTNRRLIWRWQRARTRKAR